MSTPPGPQLVQDAWNRFHQRNPSGQVACTRCGESKSANTQNFRPRRSGKGYMIQRECIECLNGRSTAANKDPKRRAQKARRPDTKALILAGSDLPHGSNNNGSASTGFDELAEALLEKMPVEDAADRIVTMMKADKPATQSKGINEYLKNVVPFLQSRKASVVAAEAERRFDAEHAETETMYELSDRFVDLLPPREGIRT